MKRTIQLLPLMLVSVIAFADSNQSALQACVAIKESAARIECFDHAMAASQSTTQTNAEMSKPESKAAFPADSTSAAGVAPTPALMAAPVVATSTAAEQPKKLESITNQGDSKLKPFTSRVTGMKRTGFAQVVLELENGQTWRQTDGVVDIFVSVDDAVSIKPSFGGGYFLTGPDHRTFRFQRVR